MIFSVNTLILLNVVGSFMDVIGKVLIAYTAIAVHHRVWQEHKIDELVFKEMSRERVIGIFGVSLLILGFALQLPGKLHG